VAVGIAAFIPRTGDAMKDSAKLKVLFIAGFGPIVRDTGESRKLYRDALGIPFKEEPDGYLTHRGRSRREEFCPMAAFSGSAVLFWQRLLA